MCQTDKKNLAENSASGDVWLLFTSISKRFLVELLAFPPKISVSLDDEKTLTVKKWDRFVFYAACLLLPLSSLIMEQAG